MTFKGDYFIFAYEALQFNAARRPPAIDIFTLPGMTLSPVADFADAAFHEYLLFIAFLFMLIYFSAVFQ